MHSSRVGLLVETSIEFVRSHLTFPLICFKMIDWHLLGFVMRHDKLCLHIFAVHSLMFKLLSYHVITIFCFY